ncbi:uncharacterized protein LOC110651852 [Hevea brasiliensis]|uniref:uncharacterized protein LOC110651852 n=1 Tax=Hevea brasiliensis TaxID=3981 RepID=UPI0025E1DEF5|nr:uncharacterized protein LOC110651852 [Hevea brasiliensis]
MSGMLLFPSNWTTGSYYNCWFHQKKISQFLCATVDGVHYNSAATCLGDWELCCFLYLLDFEAGWIVVRDGKKMARAEHEDLCTCDEGIYNYYFLAFDSSCTC